MAFGLIAGLPYRGPGSFADKGAGSKTYSAATSRLGNLGGIGRSKSADYSGKDGSTPIAFNARHGRLGNLGLIGRVGTYTGKVSAPSQEIVFSNTPSVTFTTQPFRIAQDKVINFTGVECVPITLPFQIIQGGQTITFGNTPSSVFTTKPFLIDQETAGNKIVGFSNTPRVNFSTRPFTVATNKVIEFDRALASFTAPPFEVVPGVLGEQSLSAADTLAVREAVWGKRTPHGFTAFQAMNVLLAGVAGTAFGFKPAGQSYEVGDEFGYYGSDGVTKVIKATYVGANRVIIELNPE